jgi:transcriptional regulator with XRE-family HTH domain
MTVAADRVVARRALGAELRRLRTAAGIPTERAAAELDCSVSKISRMENGLASVRSLEVKVLLGLYGVRDEAQRARLLSLGGEGRGGAWYDEYQDLLGSGSVLQRFIGLESAATSITSFSYGNIPGLLQTEEYARALYLELQPDRPAAEIDRLIELRQGRKRIFEGKVRYSVIIDETALLRPVGSRVLMRNQIDELWKAVDEGRCDLRVLPLSAGYHAILQGPFTILGFEPADDPDTVFIENVEGVSFQDRPDSVKRFIELFDSAGKSALHGRELEMRLSRAAHDFDSDSEIRISLNVSR